MTKLAITHFNSEFILSLWKIINIANYAFLISLTLINLIKMYFKNTSITSFDTEKICLLNGALYAS